MLYEYDPQTDMLDSPAVGNDNPMTRLCEGTGWTKQGTPRRGAVRRRSRGVHRRLRPGDTHRRRPSPSSEPWWWPGRCPPGRTFGHLADVVDENDTGALECRNDRGVVDDLVIAVDRPLKHPHHPGEGLDGHLDAGTESARLGQESLFGRDPSYRLAGVPCLTESRMPISESTMTSIRSTRLR